MNVCKVALLARVVCPCSFQLVAYRCSQRICGIRGQRRGASTQVDKFSELAHRLRHVKEATSNEVSTVAAHQYDDFCGWLALLYHG